MPLYSKLYIAWFMMLLSVGVSVSIRVSAQEQPAQGIAQPQKKTQKIVESEIKKNQASNQASNQANNQLSWRQFPEVKILLDQGKIQEAIQLLTTYQVQHENDPDYFNILGVLHLKNKNYTQAASAFERVVLLQTDNAGAWLDLAIANSEAGNFDLAISYFDYIQASLSPPPKVQTVINSYQQRIKRAKRLVAPWQHSAEMMLGYDTNANSGLLNNQIRVTYQGTEIDLELDKNYQPRADGYKQLNVNTRYQGNWSGKRLDFYLGAQQKTFFKEHQYSFLDVSSNVSLQKVTNYGDYGMAIGAQQFILANKALLNNYTMTFNAEHNFGECRMNYAIEAEARRYKHAITLNGNAIWLQLANTCVFPGLIVPIQTNIVLKKGRDHPEGFRPGGETDRSELMARLSANVYKQIRLDFSVNLSKAKDSEGYSVLLDNNAIRETLRRNVRLQINMPLFEDGVMTLGVEKNVMQSNLSLFRQKGQVINIGYQKRF
jgi:tetratricopeptide (TPR) repeat protein